MPTAQTIDSIKTSSANNTPLVSLAGGDTLDLLSTGVLIATGTGSPGIRATSNTTMTIAGDVFSTRDMGITVTGSVNTISIAATGSIFGGDRAVYFQGEETTFSTMPEN